MQHASIRDDYLSPGNMCVSRNMEQKIGDVISQRCGKASWEDEILIGIELLKRIRGRFSAIKRSCDSRAYKHRQGTSIADLSSNAPNNTGAAKEMGAEGGQGPCKSEHRGPTRCNQIKCQKCLGHYCAIC